MLHRFSVVNVVPQLLLTENAPLLSVENTKSVPAFLRISLCMHGLLIIPLGAHKKSLHNVFKGFDSLIAKESCRY